jgi:ABC-type multidrug transport system fused ATPase/permease subunit
VLILDEATSSVDTETEASSEALKVLPRGRTAIVMSIQWTRSWSSTRAASANGGRLELLAQRGIYWRLCDAGADGQYVRRKDDGELSRQSIRPAVASILDAVE